MHTTHVRPGDRIRSFAWGALVALLALAPSGLGAVPRDLVLEWVPPAGAALGYRAYVGNAPSLYRQIIDLGVVPIDVDGIGRATLTLDSTLDYYVAVSAYNGVGESPLSNEKHVAASVCDPSYCDDAQQCTADDCGPNGCTHTPVPDGTFCSVASNAYGMCFSGACMPAQCTQAAHCDDGNVCNGAESCGPLGVCDPGVAVRCGTSQCDVPVCDPAYGGCREVHKPDGTPCNDGRRYTTNDRCRRGSCRGTRLRN